MYILSGLPVDLPVGHSYTCDGVLADLLADCTKYQG